jgi:hypothetical protein
MFCDRSASWLRSSARPVPTLAIILRMHAWSQRLGHDQRRFLHAANPTIGHDSSTTFRALANFPSHRRWRNNDTTIRVAIAVEDAGGSLTSSMGSSTRNLRERELELGDGSLSRYVGTKGERESAARGCIVFAQRGYCTATCKDTCECMCCRPCCQRRLPQSRDEGCYK